jgi:asparagine synthase (glutamine-hydrolysing)
VPGLAGILGEGSTAERRSAIERMVAAMSHEPFHTSGLFSLDTIGVHAGWVCHRGSFSDCLPIWNAAGDIGLLFSGEHFDDAGEPSVSALVHRYEESGTAEFLRSLNGWFSGLVVDLRDRKCVLFTDRYGLGRVYVHESPAGLWFASEAKALLKLLPGLRRMDPSSLAEIFSCGCVLQNRTLFPGISVLPGGAAWTVRPGREPEKRSYFRCDTWEQQPRMSAAEYSAGLAETFARILPRYFQRAERLGISTTGGIDSRLILAGAPRQGRQICYTFGSVYRDSRDVVLARQVARISQRPHETLQVGEDFLRQFPSLCEKAVYVSDGAMDASGAIDLYINRWAREIAPIRLTGNYGSEILRGHVAFRPVSRHDELFDPAFRRLLRAAEETYAQESQCRRLSFVAFKQLPWHHYPRLALEQSQLTPRSPYLDNELVALAYRAPADLVEADRLLLAVVAQANPQLATIPTDRGIVSRSGSPTAYARRLLQELTFKAEHLYDYGMPQWLDRAFARLHLETPFLGRHKFHHFRVWYRDQLREYLRDVLLDPQARSRPYFRDGALEEMVTRHIRGDRNYTLAIHRALTCELVQRRLIDQP